jgi:hypothetical protein
VVMYSTPDRKYLTTKVDLDMTVAAI